MSRPFHDFPPPGANLKRLAPSRLALSPPSSGSNESHRPPPRPEFTPNGSRNVFRFMDEAREEADDRKARNLEFDNETTVTSMIAVSAEYPTRERRPGVQRFVRKRAPEEVEYRTAMWGIRKEGAGEKMEREESIASGGSGISGVPLPAPAKVVAGIESEKFEVERPKLLPPVEFCEEVPVFEEDDEVVEQVVEEVEEPEKVVDEAELADTLEKDIEEKLEQEEELGQSEEDEEDGDEAEEEVEDEQDQDEEEEDCDTVVEFDSGEIATEIFTEGVSVVGGRLEAVEECHDEEEEEREEGSELEEEEEAEDEETEENDLHEPHMEKHQQAKSSTHGGSDLGVSIDPDGEEDDQTAEGFLANLDNSSPPASSIFSTKSSATTVISLDSMFNPSTNQSSASSVPTAITDYSSGSSSASYIPQYMPAAFAYAPSPPPSTITSSTDYHGSTTNSSATTQYPMRNPHMMGMGVGVPHTPPRTQPGTRTTSPLLYKRTPLFPQQAGILPMTPTESQVFPRFTSLNLRLLRHLEGELVGLESMLEEIEARMANEGTQIPHENVAYHHVDGASPHGSVRSRVSSGSSDPSLPGEAGEMGAKRAEIMDALAWKLGQYSKLLHLLPFYPHFH